MLDSTKIEHFKQKLLQEKERLELELTDIGAINSADGVDWSGTPGELEVSSEDRNELADKIEEQQTNEAIVSELEARKLAVEEALKRIEDGTYGLCKVCGKPIDEERLEANPAADTCIEHAE